MTRLRFAVAVAFLAAAALFLPPSAPTRRLALLDPPPPSIVVATVGDSFTSLYGPKLHRRICGSYCNSGAVSTRNGWATGGGCLIHSCGGKPALVDDFGRVLEVEPRPTTVVVLIGINDMWFTDTDIYRLAGGYRRLFDEAGSHGVRLLIGTIPYLAAAHSRQDFQPRIRDINTWLRGYYGAANVVDFNVTTKNPWADELDPHYDSGDHLHPNAQGTDVLADSVDLSQVRPDLSTVSLR